MTPQASTTDDLPPPAARSRKVAARGFQPTLKFGVDDLLLETGGLPDAPEADTYSTLRTSAYVLWQPSRNWEFRAGARLDGMAQDGGGADHDELLADYSDTYVRYRSGDTRLTLGAQTIIWGRVDEIPLADRVSRVDLTRFVLDDLADRRRAQLAARWEQTFGDYKLDAVFLPVFRGAQLPDVASVWSPINRTTGQVIGIDPALTGWVSAARIDEDEHGSGGGALRLTKTGNPFDFGITLARTRQSLPYYRVGWTLTAVHPFNTFVGADLELVSGGLTWRMELGYTDNVPVTRPSTAMDSTHSLDWIGALEFFPGGGRHSRQPATGRARAANRPQHPGTEGILRRQRRSRDQLQPGALESRHALFQRLQRAGRLPWPQTQLRRLGATRTVRCRTLFRRRVAYPGRLPSGPFADHAGPAHPLLTGPHGMRC